MKQTASAWIILVATLMIQALVAMALITLPVVAPVVSDAIGVSTTYVGFYVAIVYVAAMISTIMGGSFVKRWGALRLSQVSLLFTATGLVLCALPWPATIVIGALMIGLGYGPVTPASSHLLIKTTPPERMSLVFSIKQTGVPVGGMLAGLLVPSMEILMGWQAAFVMVALFCVLCALAVSPLRLQLDEDRNPAIRPSLIKSFVEPIKLVLGQASLRILAAVSFLFAITQLSLTTYLVTFLYEDLGWGLVAAGLALTVSQAAGVGGRILWGWMADNWLGSGFMLIGIAGLLFGGAALVPWLTIDTPTLWLYLLLMLLGATAIGWNGVYLAEVARQAPSGLAGMATGGTLGFTFLGVLCGPPLFGVAASRLGSYGDAYALLMIPAFVIAVLLWVSRKRWVAN
ncbi:MFS transporter [Orrella daihaiensis]|uniref:MFS transporter n=1 Tax=Orrella daihaiensis TaxID=2782176 RepID=A0ABY4AN27_9BURK|nr:MFS transporter [Orrella daihaiensis]UOD50470.1 MFS transporter [Orrella daihaiensis]